MNRRRIGHFDGPCPLLFHIRTANQFDREKIAVALSLAASFFQILEPVGPVKLKRIENQRPLQIVFLHHLGRHTVDGVLYPGVFGINKHRLADRISALADLVDAIVNPLTFRLALCVQSFFCTQSFQRAERSNSGNLKNRERDVRVIFCSLDRANDFVFRVIESSFARFSFNRIIEDRSDVGSSQLNYCLFTFFDRFTAAKLFEDRVFDQPLDRQPQRQRQSRRQRSDSVQKRRIE